MKNILITVMFAGLLLVSVPGWSASTKEEVRALSVQMEAMQKDLAEIKNMIKDIKTAPAAPARPAAPVFKEQVVSVAGSPYMGEVDATLTLIEYSDYQCPFCARHYRDVLPDFIKEYIETGKLKYVMRELPLTNIHPNAMNASYAALCAGDQGQYFAMHNILFDNQRELDVVSLKGYAAGLGLDTNTFDECLDNKKHKEQVEKDMASSKIFGITGTPAFAFGVTDPEDPDKVNIKKVMKGAQGFRFFQNQINPLLR